MLLLLSVHYTLVERRLDVSHRTGNTAGVVGRIFMRLGAARRCVLTTEEV